VKAFLFFPFFLPVILLNVLFLVGIVTMVVWLLGRDRDSRPPPPRRPASLGILEERYARGEISREEFLERRSVLLGENDGALR
jgi:uncharacterized membrane protein